MENIPIVGGLLGGNKQQAAAPPPPPPPPAPAPTIDDARRRREQQDALSRKQGRKSAILTGDQGVNTAPVVVKTLIGS